MTAWTRFSTWFADGLSRMLSRFFERHDIGRAGDLYLTRWVILGSRNGPGHKLYLHRFFRSDTEAALHDHPWPFWSLLLWPGYLEHTPGGVRFYFPLSLLRRPAEWRHRVELLPGCGCWTLIWTGERCRSWGFHCPKGFVGYQLFGEREDRKEPGCGE